MITGKTFVFIGTSGSGKNVQIQKLTEYLHAINSNIKHFETGEELKKVAEEGDRRDSAVLRTIFKNGGPAPNSLIKNLFDGYLLSVKEDDVLIIDGLPRTLSQSVYIDDILARINRSINTIIIHLEVREEIALDRLLNRSAEIQNDLDPVLIKKRFSWYREDSLPCISFFRKDKDYTVITVNGESSPDEVFEELIAKLSVVLKKK